ncbi:H-NS histone family protein [Paraburkholderia bannensis]|uniref:H-NS histone family protein n=1 Tax=Paraburkholderia bannensis TaxID=765414 RepID=UPI000A032C60|nr:H-NS histone family protein [Paraburkholderia bannensis]
MTTYKELKAQIAKLEEQAAVARQSEYAVVLAEVREKVAEFGFTERDIFGQGRRHRPGGVGRGTPVAAKYKDPKTGATWSGRGRAPAWIANAKNRDRFLIDSSSRDVS